jgi:hypothetical protein
MLLLTTDLGMNWSFLNGQALGGIGKGIVIRTTEQESHPPVLVPPIKSKYSHGRGGFFGLTLFIKYFKIMSEESPRIPPPSTRKMC